MTRKILLTIAFILLILVVLFCTACIIATLLDAFGIISGVPVWVNVISVLSGGSPLLGLVAAKN